MGYVAFALDMFGAGECVFGEEKDKHNAYLNEDRTRVQVRSLAALEELNSLPVTDHGQVAAIGYCLGGKVALDLARSGPDGLLGVVSFHGILDSPAVPDSPFQAKVLACHGNLDPFVSPEMLQAFQEEMERKAVDYQVVVFGGCYHAFTRPDKTSQSDKKMGFQFSSDANRRSWQMCSNFLEEIFS
ncbi:hypothetical protein BSKO_03262 [Bryopsis sp. KO-2023]|nr:hypothetical protein BSKO_03262 [Bryopsis sp. KO-2023]